MTRPASTPFDLNVRDLVHRPGEMRERSLSFPVAEKMGEGLVGVPAGEVIEAEVRLESVHEGILVSADLETEYGGECSRCLIDIRQPLRIDFQELFAYSPDEASDFAVRNDHVDLEQAVRDAVVLALPFQPVCRPDCAGLDPETGERLVDAPARESDPPVDPRWAALAGVELRQDSGADAPADRVSSPDTEES